MKKWFTRWNVASLLLASIVVSVVVCIRSWLTDNTINSIVSGIIFVALGVIITILQWLFPLQTASKPSTQERRILIISAILTFLIVFVVIVEPIPSYTPPDKPVQQTSGMPSTPRGTSANIPTATVIPSPTPAPGQILYQADWSQGLNDWLGSTQWKPVNGELVSDGSSRGGGSNAFIIWSPAQLSTTNYKIIAQMQFLRSTTGSSDSGSFDFGIVARGNGNGSGYEGGIMTGGGLTIELTPNGHSHCASISAAIAIIQDTGENPDFSCATRSYLVNQDYPVDTNLHTYELDVKGNLYTFYIDNHQVLQTIDNSFTAAGQVGLRDLGGEINVKSFVVSAL